ncbi:MAG: hypothetical protein QXE90_01660 [Candidatus Micrarchaeia archaeon]
MKKIKNAKDKVIQNNARNEKRVNFSSVKNEQIIKRNEKQKETDSKEMKLVVTKINEIEKRKELIEIAKEVIHEFEDDDDPTAGGLLF